MQGNNLSNTVAPRLVVIFEGGMAYMPSENVDKFLEFKRKNKWWKVIECYQYFPAVIAQIERLNRNTNVNFEVCTWMGDDAAEAIANDLDEMSLPIRSVWSSTPDELGRSLVWLPDIAYIYDPDPDHLLKYGKKGVLFKDANQLGRGY